VLKEKQRQRKTNKTKQQNKKDNPLFLCLTIETLQHLQAQEWASQKIKEERMAEALAEKRAGFANGSTSANAQKPNSK